MGLERADYLSMLDVQQVEIKWFVLLCCGEGKVRKEVEGTQWVRVQWWKVVQLNT